MDRQQKPDLDNQQLRDAEKRAGRGEPLGRGMTSPDSTQEPLSAETGEPDTRRNPDDARGHGD